jgi:hypothetical protein
VAAAEPVLVVVLGMLDWWGGCGAVPLGSFLLL